MGLTKAHNNYEYNVEMSYKYLKSANFASSTRKSVHISIHNTVICRIRAHRDTPEIRTPSNKDSLWTGTGQMHACVFTRGPRGHRTMLSRVMLAWVTKPCPAVGHGSTLLSHVVKAAIDCVVHSLLHIV